MKKTRFKQIIHNPNFLKIWFSQILSLVCASTLTFVIIGKIYHLTSSTVAVGIYLFFYYLPTAVLGPFVGVFIDHWHKRSILFYSNIIQALVLMLFLGVGRQFWLFYMLGLLYSLGDEFYNPTIAVSLPSLVKKEDLTVANSLFFFTNQVSLIVGSFVGGTMLKILPNMVFVILAAVLLIASGLCFLLPKKILEGKEKKYKIWRPLQLIKNLNLNEFLDNTRQGFLFIKNEPLILFPIILLAGLQSLVGMGMIILPSLAQMIKLEFTDSPFLIILPAVSGALFGSYLLDKKQNQVRKNIFIVRGLYLMGISLMLLALLSKLLVFPTLISLFLGSSLGLGYVFIYIPLQTLIQEHTPFTVRGRVFATLSTLTTLAAAIPIFVSTALVDLFGPRSVLIVLGLGMLGLTFLSHKQKDYIINFNYYHQK